MIKKLRQASSVVLLTIIFITLVFPIGLICRLGGILKKRKTPVSYLLYSQPIKSDDMEKLF